MNYIMPECTVSSKLMQTTKVFLEQKNRRYFGKAAIGLSNQLVDPKYKSFEINKKAVQAGISGEISTSNVLRKWILDKPNMILVDSVHLKLDEQEEEFDEEESKVNNLGDTDHLLICGDTIIIIDSKNWKEKASYMINDDGVILRSKNTFPGNSPKINQSKYLWQKFYEEKNLDVRTEAFVCISNPTSFITRNLNWWKAGWKLVNHETLVYFLDKLYREDLSDVDYVNVGIVANAISGLQRPYNKFKEEYPDVYKLVKR